MKKIAREKIVRIALTAVILLTGVALIPFIELPVEAITWQSLAGVYEPELSVDEPSGGPGSIFAFTGTNYPANALATVYVDGVPLGDVMTDGSGVATFKIDSAGAALGSYNVTLEVDINASATTSFTLVADQPAVAPPPGFPGPTYSLGYSLHLPLIKRD